MNSGNWTITRVNLALTFYFRMDEWEFYDLQEDPSEMTNAYNDPKYAKEIERMKEEALKLKEQYDVPPMKEWVRMPLKRQRKPRLHQLYPDSYDEDGKMKTTRSVAGDTK